MTSIAPLKVDHLPIQALSPGPLDGLIRHWARATPNSPALADPPNREQLGCGPTRSLTFAEADALIERLARSLIGHGLQPGEKIAIQLPNIWECPLAIIAAWRARLVPCTFPLLWRQHEIEAALETIAPRAIVTVASFGGHDYAGPLLEATAKQMSVRFVIGIDADTPDGVTPLTDWLVNEGDLASTPSLPPGAEEDVAAITWSGSPLSGIPLSHTATALEAIGRSQQDQLRLSSDDIMLNPCLFSSLGGLGGFLLPWMVSGAQMLLHQPFDFDGFTAQLSKDKVTYTAVPAPVISALAKADLLSNSTSHLTRLGCVWPMGLMMQSGLDGPDLALPIYDIHNLEEFALLVRPREQGRDPNLLPLGKLPSTSGDEEAVYVETRVRGSVASGSSNTNSLQGELLVRGAGAAKKFDGILLATNESELSGFTATGILCSVEEGDNGHFRTRMDEDKIHRGGITISARELDSLYAGYPDFMDAAALALADPVLGHRVIAAVVPCPDASPTLAEFKTYLADKQVAPYKLPDQLVVIDTIPRAAEGKIERTSLLAKL